MLKDKRYEVKKSIVEFNKDAKRIDNIGRIFLSEPILSVNNKNVMITRRKIKSEIIIDSNINYDDLCGSPWFTIYKPTRVVNYDLIVPKLCIWELISFKDIIYIKEHQQDKDVVLKYFKYIFSKNLLEDRNEIFLKIAWQIFEVTRNHLFSIKCICASIGLFYLTHRYYLSNIWYTMENTYNFFSNTLLLYIVLNPPKSDEVFNFDQCELLLELFNTIYMENLALIRLTCLSHYNIKMSLNDSTIL